MSQAGPKTTAGALFFTLAATAKTALVPHPNRVQPDDNVNWTSAVVLL